jgi:precorrin-6B methylase 2
MLTERDHLVGKNHFMLLDTSQGCGTSTVNVVGATNQVTVVDIDRDRKGPEF